MSVTPRSTKKTMKKSVKRSPPSSEYPVVDTITQFATIMTNRMSVIRWRRLSVESPATRRTYHLFVEKTAPSVYRCGASTAGGDVSEAPVVLVVATRRSLVDRLVQDLRAHGLMSFGTTSGEDSVRSVGLLQPEVVVIDPTSDECSALLNNFDTSSRSLRLVAIAESEEAAERSREMGIEEVIMGDDAIGVVDAVLNLVVERHASLTRGDG